MLMKVSTRYITDFDSKQPIPDGWRVDPEQSDRLLPLWSDCQHRRVSYRPQPLVILPHCLLTSQDVTTETCLSCNRQLEERPRFDTTGPPQLEKLPGDWQEFSGGYEGPLGDIEETGELNKVSERAVRIESDGTIVYEKGEDDWEPPRDIYGYERDPDNLWRFIPLWPVCEKRQRTTKRNKSCGGILVIMMCTHSDSKRVDKEVTYKQCQRCPVREGD